MRDIAIAAVWVGVTPVRAERARHGADRAANQRPGRGTATAAGDRAESGARSGTHQTAADIDLCVGRGRRKQRDCHKSGRKQ